MSNRSTAERLVLTNGVKNCDDILAKTTANKARSVRRNAEDCRVAGDFYPDRPGVRERRDVARSDVSTGRDQAGHAGAKLSGAKNDRREDENLSWVIKLIQEYSDERLSGKLEIIFERGRIVRANQQKTLIPPDRNKKK